MRHLIKIQVLLLFCLATLSHAEKDKEKDKEKEKEKDDSTTIYSPTGKRDPFLTPSALSSREIAAIDPLEKFALEQFQLRAILATGGKNRVLFEDPEGKTHILEEGDIIGRGRAIISRILDTEVIVTEHTYNYLGVENLNEKIITLPGDEDRGHLIALPAKEIPGAGMPTSGVTKP